MCHTPGKILLAILKGVCWTVFAFILTVCAALICSVKILQPEHLTPLVVKMGNRFLNARIEMESLKLAFRPAFPVLSVEVENMAIISHAFDSLSTAEKGLLPPYADTLVTLDYMRGALDLKRLIVKNEISMHDVLLRGPGVNLVIAHNGKGNYEITGAISDTTQTSTDMPGFRIDRFALDAPKAIRFYNAEDSTAASVVLLTDAAVDGGDMPTYRLKIDGNVTSPKATLLTNLNEIDFGVNGKVFWDPAKPGLVAVDEMELRGAFIRAIVSGELDLTDNPIARKGSVVIPPVAVTDLISFLPDSVRRVHRLYAPYFRTDATLGMKFELDRPMNLTTDTIPSATISLAIPPSIMNYGKALFKELAVDMTIRTVTNQPDSTIIDIQKCVIAGPATRLVTTALVTTPISDPEFKASVLGNINLKNLPPILQERIPGYLSGTITADIKAAGKASMFSQEHIHKLNATGKATVRDIYFISADTNKMVELGRADIDFHTRKILGPQKESAPFLGMKLEIDTATVLVDGVDISLSKLELGAGVENNGKAQDSTLVVPLGGGLKIKRLNIVSITDSAGARIRNLDGHLLLRRFRGHNRIPEILADLHTGRVSAGSRTSRILINDAKIKAQLHKLPEDPKMRALVRRAKKIHKEYPHLSPDSVFKLAQEKRRHKPGEKRTPRVHGAMTPDDTEILEWNLSNGFRKFMLGWEINGSLTTRHARMLTPLFPLRNRISRLDLAFSNDTVNISNITLRAGRSDLTMSGQVTNVQRALTSKTRNTIKVNLSFLSDTIDINQLSASAFAGAAYSEKLKKGHIHSLDTEDDAALEARLDALAKENPDTVGPLLIPVNIDANLKLAANKVLYSDLMMEDMGGDLLVYGGGVNLHDIKARSDAGNISISALYSAPRPENMHFGFGMQLEDFNIGRFVKLVPAVDSIIPLIHDFAGTIDADMAATCSIDSGMNLVLPTIDAAIRISGENLAFINPDTYRTLGKWLRFKDKTDNTIKQLNVEMTVRDGQMKVYPFAFNIDRYRLGISGSNDIAMNFDYHIAVLKSPLPFKFGITVSGTPHKYKVRFGGAKFKENSVVESVDVVHNARVNLVDQIEKVFRRGVQNSRFAKLDMAIPQGFDIQPDQGLSASDSLQLIREGLIEAPAPVDSIESGKRRSDAEKKHKKFLFF